MTATERQRRWRAGVRAKTEAKKVAASEARLARLIHAAVLAATEKLQGMFEELLTLSKSIMDGRREDQLFYMAHIRRIEDELARERDRHSPPVDLDDLPKRYREKVKLARKRLEREFEERVKQGVRKELAEMVSPSGPRSELPVTETGYRDLLSVPGTEH
jgi:hypothetical protein